MCSAYSYAHKFIGASAYTNLRDILCLYTYQHMVRLRVILRVSLGTGWAQC